MSFRKKYFVIPFLLLVTAVIFFFAFLPVNISDEDVAIKFNKGKIEKVITKPGSYYYLPFVERILVLKKNSNHRIDFDNLKLLVKAKIINPKLFYLRYQNDYDKLLQELKDKITSETDLLALLRDGSLTSYEISGVELIIKQTR